jgi:Spy/CpxP family protein refolding chaperone
MKEWLDARSRPRLIAAVLLGVIFLVGTMTGAAVQQAVGAREPAESKRAPATAPHGHDAADERRARSPYYGLGLSPEQRTRVDSLLAVRHHQIDSLWSQHEPQMRAIMSATHAEILTVLTAEQRELLEQRRAERRAQRAAERGNDAEQANNPKREKQ